MALSPTSSHGSSAFSQEVTVHVPDESTPALALYNDTWDTDPADPVLVAYAFNNGDAAIALSSSGTITVGNGAGVVNLRGLITVALPTADPHVAGELWSNGGVVTVSAG